MRSEIAVSAFLRGKTEILPVALQVVQPLPRDVPTARRLKFRRTPQADSLNDSLEVENDNPDAPHI
jgi:hypothetical protein